MAFGMNFLCGPIASSLCQRYGCRVVSAAGGLIAVLGLLLTSFTNSIYVIYLTYSILWGFGSSLNYAPTMLVLSKLHSLSAKLQSYCKIRWFTERTSGHSS